MQGVQQALDEKLPLDQYVGVAVIVHPPPSDAGADAVQIDGQIYVGVVLDLNGQLSFVAQETGHALMTVDHSWGPTREYRDPYCVMSAWVWGGFDPSYQRPAADASLGAQYWSRAGPMVAAAMLANYVPHFTNSYSKAEVDPDFVNSPRLLTLSALNIPYSCC